MAENIVNLEGHHKMHMVKAKLLNLSPQDVTFHDDVAMFETSYCVDFG